MSVSAEIQQNVHHLQSVSFDCQKIYNKPLLHEYAVTVNHIMRDSHCQ